MTQDRKYATVAASCSQRLGAHWQPTGLLATSNSMRFAHLAGCVGHLGASPVASIPVGICSFATRFILNSQLKKLF